LKDLDLIKNLPELVDFVVGFAKNPAHALKPYAGEGNVNAKLTLFVVVSVGLSVLTALLASTLGVRDDESQFLRVVRSFDAKVLPVVAVISLVVITIVGHAVARLSRSEGRHWRQPIQAPPCGRHLAHSAPPRCSRP
jgi:hypothetical protein